PYRRRPRAGRSLRSHGSQRNRPPHTFSPSPLTATLTGVHTVAILSLKGGVGKTTVALGIASAAVHRGPRTLVGDLDPPGNATPSLDPPLTDTTLVDVLENPELSTIESSIAASNWSSALDVLGGSEDLELLNEPTPHDQKTNNLARTIEQLRHLSGDTPYEL